MRRPRGLDAMIGQQRFQPFPRAFGIGGEHHRPLCAAGGDMLGQRVEHVGARGLAFRGEAAPDAPARVDERRLPLRLALQRAVNGAEAVHVLDLDLCA